MKRTFLALAPAALLSIAATSSALAEDLPNFNDVAITSISAFGSGCSSGTANATLSPDRQAFSVLFDHYEVDVGGSDPTTDRKTCDINLELTVPEGWSFTLSGADYRGFANIDPGTMAIHQVIYSFDRASPNDPARSGTRPGRFSFETKQFNGPYSSDYLIHYDLPPGQLSWSPCTPGTTKVVNVSTVLAARVMSQNPAGAKAMITLDSVDATMKQQYNIKWRRCDRVAPPPSRPPGTPPNGGNPVGQPTPPPSAGGGSGVAVYRLSNGRDSLLTTNPNEGLAQGYRNLGVALKVDASPARWNPIPIYRCVNPGQASHFLSAQPSCEGGRQEAILGYISANGMPGLVPITRWVSLTNPADRPTFAGSVAVDRRAYRPDTTLGFGLP